MADGMAMLQGYMDAAMASSPVKVKLLDQTMPIYGFYDTPTLGAALFHESTFNDLLWKGLSLTVGLRADYEKMDIRDSIKLVREFLVNIDKKYLEKKYLQRDTDEQIISVHIRRGDYREFMGGKFFFEDDIYVKKITVNGKIIKNHILNYEEIKNGGKIMFEMSNLH